MASPRSADMSRGTRQALLDAARDLFAARGYADTPTEVVVHSAGVTRGALYHHFGSKQGLFQAVFEQVAEEIATKTLAGIGPAGDPWQDVVTAAHAFLDASTDRTTLRLAFAEAPAVLGWAQMRELDGKYGMKIFRDRLQRAMDEHAIDAQPVGPLTHVVLAVLIEAALLIGQAADPAPARDAVIGTVDRLLEGLRIST